MYEAIRWHSTDRLSVVRDGELKMYIVCKWKHGVSTHITASIIYSIVHMENRNTQTAKVHVKLVLNLVLN